MTQSKIQAALAAIISRSLDFKPDPVATRESFAHGEVDGDSGYMWGMSAPIGATRAGSVSTRTRYGNGC